MAFRVVLIESEVLIRIKLNNLVVTREENDIWIPLDDIAIIVIDNLASNISFRVLCQLADNNIGLIVCDTKHLPIGYYGAYDNHVRSSKILGSQISFTEDENGDIWKEIVIAKINNQAKAYLRIKKDEKGYESIRGFADEVTKGDKTNREAHAAKVYFNLLMENTYSRGNEDIILNSALDYGYAILRSYLARLCVGYGLNTQLGIHHKNEYNRFNLVDDLMEPFRPIVDLIAYSILGEEEYFKPEHRRQLVNLPNHQIVYNNKRMYLGNAMTTYIEQVAAMFTRRATKVEFPNVDCFLGEEDEV